MLLNTEQKKLILNILAKEKRKLLSKHKGRLLDKTISDFQQTLRNEKINEINFKQ